MTNFNKTVQSLLFALLVLGTSIPAHASANDSDPGNVCTLSTERGVLFTLDGRQDWLWPVLKDYPVSQYNNLALNVMGRSLFASAKERGYSVTFSFDRFSRTHGRIEIKRARGSSGSEAVLLRTLRFHGQLCREFKGPQKHYWPEFVGVSLLALGLVDAPF